MTKIRLSDLKPNNPRQIRYSMATHISEDTLTPHYWAFFILNTEEEAKRIKQRLNNFFSLHTDFSICQDMQTLESGILVKEHSLLGTLVTLKSSEGVMRERHRPQIYASENWHLDRNLKTEPMTYEELNAYCDRLRLKQ